ncbi:MAG: FAD-binding oxidoreductase [Myxococcota bacterium]
MNFDFPVSDFVRVRDDKALGKALAKRKHVRLVGGGSSQAFLQAPDTEVDVVSTADMTRILRLEADDLTCSVEPGVTRENLDAALADHNLWLPCGGTGTIGGIFAGDRTGPLAPAQHEPRSLLLGLSAVLTDGTRFKSGARVVKSVAGFDLQKLFVGSRGRLFAVTAMHLKLRPKPPAIVAFEQDGLSLPASMELLLGMRQSHIAPLVLSLARQGPDFTLTGSIGGDPQHLETWIHGFGLSATKSTAHNAVDESNLAENVETIQGLLPLQALPKLLEQLPGGAPFVLHGLRFSTRLPTLATDRLLQDLPSIGGSGEIVVGPASRRGRTSPVDPVVARLEAELAQILDPRGVLR